MIRSSTRRLRLTAGSIAAAIVAAAAIVGPVAAREPVDPSTLNPPPPPFVNAVCGWSGDQVICARDYRFTVTDDPTGIICDGDELLETDQRHVFGHSYYDSNLNLVKRDLAERIDGFLYNPRTGVSVRWTGADQGFSVLSTPGDLSTGTGANVGNILHVYLDSGRSYMFRAGRDWVDQDTGDFTMSGINNQFGFDFCQAIAANS
jgi:hypothetical protein